MRLDDEAEIRPGGYSHVIGSAVLKYLTTLECEYPPGLNPLNVIAIKLERDKKVFFSEKEIL